MERTIVNINSEQKNNIYYYLNETNKIEEEQEIYNFNLHRLKLNCKLIFLISSSILFVSFR